MRLFTIALDGEVLKGLQVYCMTTNKFKYQSLVGLTQSSKTQLFFDSKKEAYEFLSELSQDKSHVWFGSSVYLLEEFDVFETEVDKNRLENVPFINNPIGWKDDTYDRGRVGHDLDSRATNSNSGSSDFDPYH